MVVWRGTPTRNPLRRALLRRHHDSRLCDIGHTRRSVADFPWKPFMPVAGQLRYKYVLSVEGNDVATNLKWILASNSLCLMPAPRMETWFMEGRLVAGHHYVQVRDDFSDLEEKILYYERNTQEALEIIAERQGACRPIQRLRPRAAHLPSGPAEIFQRRAGSCRPSHDDCCKLLDLVARPLPETRRRRMDRACRAGLIRLIAGRGGKRRRLRGPAPRHAGGSRRPRACRIASPSAGGPL